MLSSFILRSYSAVMKAVLSTTFLVVLFIYGIQISFAQMEQKSIEDQTQNQEVSSVESNLLSSEPEITNGNQVEVSKNQQENDELKSDKITSESEDPISSELEPEAASLQSIQVVDPEAQTFGKYIPPVVEVKNGGLKYKYPILLPPGRKGMTPDINLLYNSGNKSRDSIISSGWSLDIPYIQRLNKYGSEQLYNSDSFLSSLDGELLGQGGGVYIPRTENGQFLRYQFASSSWIVTDKIGTKYYFGETAGARHENPSDNNMIFSWMLEKIEDLNGNTISFTYLKHQGQIYPDTIKYNQEDLFEVDFVWEESATSSSYIPMFEVKTAKRLSEVEVSFDTNLVLEYRLEYNQDLLDTVEVIGYIDQNEDVTLTTTFSYTQESSLSWSEESLTSYESLWSDDEPTVFQDVNGDGLDDMVYAHNEDGRHTRINNGDGTFSVDSNWTLPSQLFIGTDYDPSMNFSWADINGDGLIDIVDKSASGNPRTYKAYINNASGWNTTHINIVLPDSHPGGLTFTDVNGDGLSDAVVAYTYTNPVTHLRYTYINNGDGTFSVDENWALDESIFVKKPYQIQNFWWAEINGDGLIDVVRKNSENISIYLNNGNGWDWNDEIIPTSISDLKSKDYVAMIDVNGDGLSDCFYADGNPYRAVYINDGNGNFNHINIGDDNILNGRNATSYFWWAEINGDGLIDVIYDKINGPASYEKNTNVIAGKIDVITGHQGGSLSATYSTVQQEEIAGSYNVPFIVDIVSSIVANDSLGMNAETNYEYKNASFYFGGPRDKKFSGFGEVVQGNPDGSVVVTKYHQGNDNTNSEPSDSYAKIGRQYEETIQDGSNNKYLTKRFNYIETPIGTTSTSTLLTSEVVLRYDGDSSHVDSATEYIYDSYGNVTIETQYGEVTASIDGTFTDIGTDKRIVESNYTNNTSDYIVGLPITQTTKNSTGTIAAVVNYLYDESGNVIEEGRWIEGIDYATTSYMYNTYGLISSTIDPLGNETSYEYEEFSLYPATTTNALGQKTVSEYDYLSGKVTSIIDSNGGVKEYMYDGLGRLIDEKKSQGNGSPVILRSIFYHSTTTPQYTYETIYEDSDESHVVVTYQDGFGREIQKKSEYEEGWATIDTEYDEMGRPYSVSIPYHSNTGDDTSRTQVSDRLSVNTYDPLGRILSVTNVRGVTEYFYDGFSSTITDAEENEKTFVEDAFTNLVAVQEENETSTYTTNYEYNTQNNLTNITDALGNMRNISYDGLGRRTALEDLHTSTDLTFGVWSFVYDDINLISALDPVGDITTYSYDELNRLLTEDSDSTSYVDIGFVYDNCINGIGRLCSIVSDGATTTYVYYKNGLVDEETVFIDETPYTTETIYNRQDKPVSIIYPDSTEVTYEYNLEGLPESVSVGTSTLTTIEYGVHGKPVQSVQSNGVVTNYFYDEDDLYSLIQKTSEIETGNIITSTTTIPATSSVVFFDNFESGFASWFEQGESDWNPEQESELDVPGSSSSNKVAHADNCDSYCTLHKSNLINLSNVASATLSFWRFVDNEVDKGEYLNVTIKKNGNVYNTLKTWTNGDGNDNQWHYETFDITPYVGSQTYLLFSAKSSLNTEALEIDDVKVTVHTPSYEVTSTSTEKIEIQNLTYTYDDVGNITSIVDASDTDTAKTQSFTYDDLYRLTSVTTTDVATGTTPYTQTFTYSPIGNITNFDGTTLSYGDNGYNNPHAVTNVGSTTHTYNNNGNLTNDGLWTHTWDYRNRLISSTDGSETTSYGYDHNGDRVSKTTSEGTTYYPFANYEITDTGTTTKHIYMGDQLVATIEGSGAGALTYYNHLDHLGSVQVMTDGIGAVQSVTDYYPYGDIRIDEQYGDFSHSRKFLGEIRDDETGLNYMGARYYDGQVGRFTAQDPANLDLGSGAWEAAYGRPLEIFLRDPQQLNTYSYARNNPMVVTDPGGDIIPLALAVAYAGLAVYDTVSTAQTVADPNASGMSKAVAVGLWASPVGELKALGNLGEQAIKKGSQIPEVMSAIKYGQQMHKNYRPFGSQSAGGSVEVMSEFRIPGYGRADAVQIDHKNRVIQINELKPNNARAIQQGERQLQRYSEGIGNMREYKGYEVRTKVDTYDRKKRDTDN